MFRKVERINGWTDRRTDGPAFIGPWRQVDVQYKGWFLNTIFCIKNFVYKNLIAKPITLAKLNKLLENSFPCKLMKIYTANFCSNSLEIIPSGNLFLICYVLLYYVPDMLCYTSTYVIHIVLIIAFFRKYFQNGHFKNSSGQCFGRKISLSYTMQNS